MTGHDTGAADSVEALAQTVMRLRSERDGLREAMRNRAVIEQAKGMLAERMSLDPEGAFRQLVELSTRNNVKVAELAAAVVSGQQPQPPELTEADVDSAPRVPTHAEPAAETLAVDAAALRSEIRLIGTRLAAATTFDELADSLAVETGAWPAPANVIVLLVEGDGALRLVGSAGLSITTRGQWDRVPPIDNVPVVAAVRQRAQIYLADLEAVSRQFPVVADRPHEALVAMPLMSDDAVIGVLEITWAKPLTMDKHDRSQLVWLAGPAARRCVELAERPQEFTGVGGDEDDVNVGLVRPFMEALSLPAVLMAPRFDEDGQVVDYTVELANDAGASVVTPPASLLTALPDAGTRTLLPAFSATLNGGEPCHLRDVAIVTTRDGHPHVYHVDVRASRLWDRLLVTWKTQSEPARHHASMLLAEDAFKTGAFSWDLEAGDLRWTPGMFRITDLDPSLGVPSIDAIAALIHPADQESLVQQVADTLRAGNELRKDLRGDGALTGRVFHIVVNAELNADGEVRAVGGACRDITDARRLGDRMRRERVAGAAWRDDRDAVRGVMDEVLKPLATSGAAGAIDVSGFVMACDGTGNRCWYDTIDVPGGGLVLIVGEVHADDPTAPMLRLRHAAAAYAVARMDPDAVLTEANALLTTAIPGRTATMTVARLDPSSDSLCWASAGQAAPVLVHSRGPRQPSDAMGLPLGAAGSTTYPLNRTVLAPGDRLLMYTDHLVTAAGGAPIRVFEALREAAEADTAEAAHQRICQRDPGLAETEASLLAARRRH